jgi:hypothetical protein
MERPRIGAFDVFAWAKLGSSLSSLSLVAHSRKIIVEVVRPVVNVAQKGAATPKERFLGEDPPQSEAARGSPCTP